MRALRRVAPGVAALVDVELPRAREGEVLVRMLHAAINPFDLQVLRGEIGADPRRTLTLGAEGVGMLGGRLVQVSGMGLGSNRDGTFASWATVPREAVRDLPDGMDPRRAATVGVAGKTAWRAVHQLARITAEDLVLVLGASGGVGSFAAQLAKATGARVLAHTASDAKAARLAERGVEAIVAASAAEVADAVPGMDVSVVLDPLGGDYVATLLPQLALRARVVSYGVLAGRLATFDLGVFYGRGVAMMGTSGGTAGAVASAEALTGVLESVLNGSVQVDVDALSLDDAHLAIRRLTDRGVTGKLVLDL